MRKQGIVIGCADHNTSNNECDNKHGKTNKGRAAVFQPRIGSVFKQNGVVAVSFCKNQNKGQSPASASRAGFAARCRPQHNVRMTDCCPDS